MLEKKSRKHVSLDLGTKIVMPNTDSQGEELLSTSPDTNNGEDREDIVKDEIENHDNTNSTITKTISKLGTVSISDNREQKQQECSNNRNQKKANITQKRMEMDRAKQDKDQTEPYASMRKKQRSYEERQAPVNRNESKNASTSRPATPRQSGAGTTNTHQQSCHNLSVERPPKIKEQPQRGQARLNQKQSAKESIRTTATKATTKNTKATAKGHKK